MEIQNFMIVDDQSISHSCMTIVNSNLFIVLK